MLMQSARNMTDRNGNWMAGEALERLLGHSSVADANGLGGGSISREMGVGTAGVGWSHDGRQLYVFLPPFRPVKSMLTDQPQ